MLQSINAKRETNVVLFYVYELEILHSWSLKNKDGVNCVIVHILSIFFTLN